MLKENDRDTSSLKWAGHRALLNLSRSKILNDGTDAKEMKVVTIDVITDIDTARHVATELLFCIFKLCVQSVHALLSEFADEVSCEKFIERANCSETSRSDRCVRASVRVDDSPKTPILSVHGRIEVYRQDMLLECSGAYKSVDNIVVFHVERKLADYAIKVNFGSPAGMS